MILKSRKVNIFAVSFLFFCNFFYKGFLLGASGCLVESAFGNAKTFVMGITPY